MEMLTASLLASQLLLSTATARSGVRIPAVAASSLLERARSLPGGPAPATERGLAEASVRVRPRPEPGRAPGEPLEPPAPEEFGPLYWPPYPLEAYRAALAHYQRGDFPCARFHARRSVYIGDPDDGNAGALLRRLGGDRRGLFPAEKAECQ